MRIPGKNSISSDVPSETIYPSAYFLSEGNDETEARSLARWSCVVHAVGFAGLKFPDAVLEILHPGESCGKGICPGCCWVEGREQRSTMQHVQQERNKIRSIRYIQAYKTCFCVVGFFLPFSASQWAGGDLVPGLSPSLEEGEVYAGWGKEEEEGQGRRKRDTGPGHLPRKITSILQKRNPKTEVIVWKKSVSQTL